jgi:hypothetical protein
VKREQNPEAKTTIPIEVKSYSFIGLDGQIAIIPVIEQSEPDNPTDDYLVQQHQ